MFWRNHRTILILAIVLLGAAACQPAGSSGAAGQTLAPTPILLRPAPASAAQGGTAALRQPTSAVTPAASSPATPASSAGAAGTGGGTPASGPGAPAAPQAAAPQSARIMALGNQAAVTLRSAPDPTARSVAVLAGSNVFWATGRSARGDWLYVTYDETGSRAWAGSSELDLLGDAAGLPVITAEAQAGARPTPAAAGQAGPPAAGLRGEVAAQGSINLRAGPGLDQPVAAALAAGTTLTVTGRSQDAGWLAVASPAGTGWVAANLVALDGNVMGLPAVAASTGPAQAAASAAADAAAPAAGGKIAFETRSGGDIYVMNGDGSGLRRIASGLDPAWSPDGAHLAYVRWQSANDAVYIFDLRTGQEQRVAGALRPRAPAWSAGGDRLVFARVVRSYTCTDTPFGCLTEAQARPIFRGQDCITLPRIGQICLGSYPVRTVDISGLTQVAPSGEGWQDLPAETSAQSPGWRPGPAQLLYRNERGLQLLEGQNSHLLLADAQVNSPAWSPDGAAIAFQAHVHDHADIFTVDAAGGGRTALTQRAPLSTSAVNNVAPAWSPDGRQILFLTDRDGAWRLYIMNADGTGQRPFLPEALRDISFSYDFAAERMVSWSR